jgi:DNA-binding transcriptional MerR regulator
MTIGRFARLSGLSIHAPRLYEDVDLLHPAEVDASTGYRRSVTSQLTTARLIVDLRWLNVPLEGVRIIVTDPPSADAHQILADHRARLERNRAHVTRQLASIDGHLTEGITMPLPMSGLAPVQIKITVHDLAAARAFYRNAFGLEEQTVRHTDEADYPAFQFGTYGQKDFFLLHLLSSDGPDFDRSAPTTFGLLVKELDQAHAAAVDAGATELLAPKDAEGMPRHSAVRDPSGNCIWLYQG